MKHMLLFLSVVSAVTLFSFTPGANGLKVNTSLSTVNWTGYKVTGKHHGLINLKSGELQFQDNKLVGGDFTIDMTSISCLDMTGDYADKLVNHLKSDDFFGVASFPTAQFKISQAVPQGNGLYKLIGKLTVKGTTKDVRFNAQIKEENGVKVANAQIKLDRADFNVKYGSGSFFDNLGDKTIYDEFDLDVKIVTQN